ncbi:MAG TPA: TldD/PmbA family protein [Geobacteraceae bacterium]|nr:TldD/PmbA family protein [Geobacteraceae bacterium]
MNIIKLADAVEAILAARSPDGYEIMTGHSTTLSIEAREGKVDTFKSAEPVGVSIRLLKNGSMGFSYSSSFAPSDLEKMVDNALTGALSQCADEANIFPAPLPFRAMPELYDEGVAEVDLARKIERALELERLALAADNRIKRVRKATYGETLYSIHIRNSNGVCGEYRGSTVSSSLAALAEADGDSQMGWDFEFGAGFDSVDIGRIAQRAVSKSVSMLGARKVPTMRAPVVLDNHVAAEFLELLAPSFSAENLFKGKSLLKDKQGIKLFSQLLSVRDDGTLPGGMATSPFDGEGVPHRNNLLVEEGVIRAFLYDTKYGAKLGMPSSGNSARGGVKGMPHLGVSNFFIENGPTSAEGLLSGISRGMLLTGLIGMHTANPVSGDFSVGATGFLVENGVVTVPVKGVAIAGNVLDIFADVEMVGDDLRFYSSVGAPSLRIASLDISGE